MSTPQARTAALLAAIFVCACAAAVAQAGDHAKAGQPAAAAAAAVPMHSVVFTDASVPAAATVFAGDAEVASAPAPTF